MHANMCSAIDNLLEICIVTASLLTDIVQQASCKVNGYIYALHKKCRDASPTETPDQNAPLRGDRTPYGQATLNCIKYGVLISVAVLKMIQCNGTPFNDEHAHPLVGA